MRTQQLLIQQLHERFTVRNRPQARVQTAFLQALRFYPGQVAETSMRRRIQRIGQHGAMAQLLAQFPDQMAFVLGMLAHGQNRAVQLPHG